MLNTEPETTCEHCGGRGKIPTPAELRNRRHRAGMTLSDVARLAGVTVGYLSDVERGKRHLSARIRVLYEGIE